MLDMLSLVGWVMYVYSLIMYNIMITEFEAVNESIECNFDDPHLCGYLNIGQNPSQWLQYCPGMNGIVFSIIVVLQQ